MSEGSAPKVRISAICNCNCHRGPHWQKPHTFGDETTQCPTVISVCNGKSLAIAISRCNFRAENPFFLREVWRFGSSAKSLAICDCDVWCTQVLDHCLGHVLTISRFALRPPPCGGHLPLLSRSPVISVKSPEITRLKLRWIQEGFKGGGFLQKHLNPIRAVSLGDSVRILGVSPTVTPTFGL